MESPSLLPAPILAPLGPPPDEAEYTDQATAKAALQSHARAHGYSISVESSCSQHTVYNCSKGGKYRDKGKNPETHESKRRKNTSTMKTGCPWQAVAKNSVSGGCKVEVVENNHNHEPVAALSALPQHRIASTTSSEKARVKEMQSLGYPPSQILCTIFSENKDSLLMPRDIYNLLAGFRIEELNRQTPIEWLLQVIFVMIYRFL
jgi:transcription factor AFT